MFILQVLCSHNMCAVSHTRTRLKSRTSHVRYHGMAVFAVCLCAAGVFLPFLSRVASPRVSPARCAKIHARPMIKYFKVQTPGPEKRENGAVQPVVSAGHGRNSHTFALLPQGTDSTMAQTGVSGPVDWWSTVSRRGKLFGRAHTVALLPEEAARPMLRRTSPGPWWSTEKAFCDARFASAGQG